MISLYNISKIHKVANEENAALKNITFSFNRGDFIAITGPSGSGKTTLMDIICMITRPTYGKYVFENTDVSLMSEADISNMRVNKIGILFQATNLIPELTVCQNMEIPLLYKGLGVAQRREKVELMLDYLGLSNYINVKPGEINRSKQQIAALGRSLMNDPDLIVADEPTGDVDSITAEEILGIFQKINAAGKTIVYVTHDIDVARHAKRVVCLKDGELVKDVILAKPINSAEVLMNLRQKQNE